MINFHSHQPQPEAIVNLPRDLQFSPDAIGILGYSAGIHPWDSATAGDDLFERLREVAARPEVVMIGECGLDALRGAPLYRQEPLFVRHVELSEELGKPMVVHCVKAYNQLLRYRRELKPRQPWVLHGFRGNDTVAAQMMQAGIALSYGPHFNVAALRATRLDHLYVETDDDPDTPIQAVYEAVADALGIDAAFLATAVANNLAALLQP